MSRYGREKHISVYQFDLTQLEAWATNLDELFYPYLDSSVPDLNWR